VHEYRVARAMAGTSLFMVFCPVVVSCVLAGGV
jgi:hypothetical protein